MSPNVEAPVGPVQNQPIVHFAFTSDNYSGESKETLLVGLLPWSRRPLVILHWCHWDCLAPWSRTR